MGLTYNGTHSNTYTTGTTVKRMPVLPPKRQYIETVQGRDGNYVVEDGYDNIVIEVEFGIGDYNDTDRRNNARQIAGWLSNTGILALDVDPEILYDVVAINHNVNAAFESRVEKFTVSFECKPYKKWNNQSPQQVGAGTIVATNGGTYKALPIITLAGTAASVTLTLGTKSFTFTNLAGTVIVDCAEQVVYSAGPVNEIGDFSGDFLELAPGDNNVVVSGSITSLTTTVDFWDTYI